MVERNTAEAQALAEGLGVLLDARHPLAYDIEEFGAGVVTCRIRDNSQVHKFMIVVVEIDD